MNQINNKEITTNNKMKYEEFKEIILKIDVKEIELDEVINKSIIKYGREITNFELDWMVGHLKNLAEYFEKRVNFENSQERQNRRKKFKEEAILQKQLEEGEITVEEFKKPLGEIKSKETKANESEEK